MKLIRSTKCSLKFATESKIGELRTILTEYGKICNIFIDYFWKNGTPSKSDLLKDIVDLPKDTWLSARLRKVAAREAIDMIVATRERKTRVTTQNKITEAEKLAQDLLRDMITETEFRNYLKYGFLLIPVGEKTYQIFKDRSHTKVWVKGKVVEELCIRIKSEIQCPPTDGVITKKILLESSEELFRSKCNVYNMLMAA